MDIGVEYYEYDCGRPCTPDGCPGHVTDNAIAIWVNGVRLVEENYALGNGPTSSEDVQKVTDAIHEIYDACTDKKPSN